MVLVILVIAGVAVFCFSQGYIVIGIICLVGVSKRYGWPALMITTGFLFTKRHWFVGSLPVLLIAWNLIGLRLFYKHRWQALTGEADTGDVWLNFLQYCVDYLSYRAGLSNEQAEILLLDTELGSDIDKAKRQWLCEDVGLGTDPDKFLVPRAYDAPQMQRINDILDKYAMEYPVREQKIKDYLKSMGHPLGNS